MDGMGWSRASWDGVEYSGMVWGRVDCCRCDTPSPSGLSAGHPPAAAAPTPSAARRRSPASRPSVPPAPVALPGLGCLIATTLWCGRFDIPSPPEPAAAGHSAAAAWYSCCGVRFVIAFAWFAGVAWVVTSAWAVRSYSPFPVPFLQLEITWAFGFLDTTIITPIAVTIAPIFVSPIDVFSIELATLLVLSAAVRDAIKIPQHM